MLTKLVQKQLFKATREFELVEGAVMIRSRASFGKGETRTVSLASLNPEPVITRNRLEFTSRGSGEVLLSLLPGQPDAKEFNAFVQNLKQALQAAHQGPGEPAHAPALPGNVYEEPPDFDADPETPAVRKPVRVAAVEESIDMLSRYVGGEQIEPLLAVLKSLQAEPANPSHLSRLIEVFDQLGPAQGIVLNYAPYVSVLLTDSAPRKGNRSVLQE